MDDQIYDINESTVDGDVSEIYSDSNGTNIYLVLPVDGGDESLSLDENKVSKEVEEMTLKSVNVSSEKISASDATGFKSQLLSVIGDYETIITDYTYQSSNGYVTHSIDVQPDFAWMAAALFALIGVYSVFRIIGMLFNR